MNDRDMPLQFITTRQECRTTRSYGVDNVCHFNAPKREPPHPSASLKSSSDMRQFLPNNNHEVTKSSKVTGARVRRGRIMLCQAKMVSVVLGRSVLTVVKPLGAHVPGIVPRILTLFNATYPGTEAFQTSVSGKFASRIAEV
jgi:hypothetical protein